MNLRVAELHHQRIRAPGEDRAALIEPPLDHAPRMLAENRELLAAQTRFEHLRETARCDLLADAIEYTSQYRDVTRATSLGLPLVLAGHQPQMFHPGVWVKNFAASSIAQAVQGAAVNLLIDNDICQHAAIQTPTREAGQERVAVTPLDAQTAAIPFEERGIRDHPIFQSFARRVAETIRPFVAEPLASAIWPDAVQAAQRTGRLGASLAAARHALEGRWGLNTLELPLSRVCESPPFRAFAAMLLAEAPRFREIYNDSLLLYRRVNRIRGQAHPAPQLAADNAGWLEAPFWIWTAEQPRRGRLFVRLSDAGVEFSDRGRLHWQFAAQPSEAALADCLAALSAAGVKLRPRALITTMYARLILSDLFLHGIGGAKYDQLTDLIASRFFDAQPPAFLTLSATLLLPIELPNVTPDDVRQCGQMLRELTYHPELHARDENLPDAKSAAALVAEKRQLLANIPREGSRRPWLRSVERVNAELQPFIADQRRQVQAQRSQLIEQLRLRRMLGSREFSFCLYPE